jgi:hypothetical protein
MRCRIVVIPAYCHWEGRRLMRTATIVSLICAAAALSGCGWQGHNVEFVASNPESVLLDIPSRPPGELVVANEAATEQCRIYSPRTAVLESLNTRGEGGVIRATYLCKGGAAAMETRTSARHRQ